MKQLLKRMLYAFAPQSTTAFMSARAREHSHKVVKEWGCIELNEKLIQRFGAKVQEGPFAGLLLSPMTYAEHLGPYLLGAYESELDSAWETVFQGTYSQIVDVGSKFGYYAVGLARRYSSASVVAFDTDWWAREAVGEMARLNCVDNVIINGFCDQRWLKQSLYENSFVLSDCEGYESVLFTKEIISKLTSGTLLIETHDCFVPGVSDSLRDTFQESHVVQTFGDENTRRIMRSGLEFLTEHEKSLANREVRPPQEWLLCVPKAPNVR